MLQHKKLKKASDEQKEYLLNFMEENIDFALDRLESSDAAHIKANNWQMLTKNLNKIRGASKDVNQWRKYWRDQKLHAKEREALFEASFQKSRVNGVRKKKQLNTFDKRVTALLSNTAINNADVSELFISPQEQAEVIKNIKTDLNDFSQSSQPIKSSEDEISLSSIIKSPELGCTMITTKSLAMAGAEPSPALAKRPYRKRKKAPSGKNPEISFFEEKMMKIEAKKLLYMKKCWELKQKSFTWKREYQEKLLDLRQREVSLQEKKLQFKMQNKH